MEVYPPVIKHGLLENGPLIGKFPIKTSIPKGFSIAMFDYQMVHMTSLWQQQLSSRPSETQASFTSSAPWVSTWWRLRPKLCRVTWDVSRISSNFRYSSKSFKFVYSHWAKLCIETDLSKGWFNATPSHQAIPSLSESLIGWPASLTIEKIILTNTTVYLYIYT